MNARNERKAERCNECHRKDGCCTEVSWRALAKREAVEITEYMRVIQVVISEGIGGTSDDAWICCYTRPLATVQLASRCSQEACLSWETRNSTKRTMRMSQKVGRLRVARHWDQG